MPNNKTPKTKLRITKNCGGKGRKGCDWAGATSSIVKINIKLAA